VRYTPEETLADAVATLEAHVAPHVPAGHPSVALGIVVGALRRLGRSWQQALPFLVEQNAELRVLLGEPDADPVAGFGAAYAENVRLNAALAARIGDGEPSADVRDFVRRWTEREAELTGTDTSEMLPF
jgi:hypothetical protein